MKLRMLATVLTISLNPCSNGMLIECYWCSVHARARIRLNPCSNGMLIELFSWLTSKELFSLNPCSNGMLIELEVKYDQFWYDPS